MADNFGQYGKGKNLCEACDVQFLCDFYISDCFACYAFFVTKCTFGLAYVDFLFFNILVGAIYEPII